MHLTSFYTAVVYHSGWPVASLSLARYCECSARLTSKPSISQLVFGSLLIKLAKTRLELQKLWPRFHKESNDVKISGHAATSYHSETWEELKALLKSGNGGATINQRSLTLSHSWLISAFSLFLPLSPIQSFGLSQPATAHFKPISDRPASCTSAENHKLFYWMKFLQSDELSVTDSRYTASVLCEWKCASCQIFKKK